MDWVQMNPHAPAYSDVTGYSFYEVKQKTILLIPMTAETMYATHCSH